MRIDGAEMVPLLHANGEWNTVAFSPDSHWLLLEHDEYPKSRERYQEVLYRLSVPDGSDLTRLTNPLRNASFVIWSPDGRALVRTESQHTGMPAFELVDLGSGRVTWLMQGQYLEFKGWTEDHTAARFTRSTIKDTRWYQVNLDGTNLKEIQSPSS
jgi:Tol biopolymer transport system component